MREIEYRDFRLHARGIAPPCLGKRADQWYARVLVLTRGGTQVLQLHGDGALPTRDEALSAVLAKAQREILTRLTPPGG